MMFASFRSSLPWDDCNYDDWANYRCEMSKLLCDGSNDTLRGNDGLCYNSTFFPETSMYNVTECFKNNVTVECYQPLGDFTRNLSNVIGFWNESLTKSNGVNPQLSTEQYFYHSVLGQYEGYNVENIGTPSWGLALCLLLSWILVFLCCKFQMKISVICFYLFTIFQIKIQQ